MAESTLSLEITTIRNRVSRFVGTGGDFTLLNADKKAQVNDAINSGYRRFLFPISLDGQKPHQWSFLRPTATLTTVASDFDYNMPDDFGEIVDPFLHYGYSDQKQKARFTTVERIYELRQQSNQTGKPTHFAVRPRALDATVGQRWEMLVWPTPDAAYTLTYRYSVLPDRLTVTDVFPYGGLSHSETIMEACLASAEEQFHDDPNGPHKQAFLALLDASIKRDRAAHTGRFIGYNGDASSERPVLVPRPYTISHEVL